MHVIHGFSALGYRGQSPAVTVGNFDGVHRGHQHVISSTMNAARERATEAVVCTFEPHTRKILRPAAPPRVLQTLPQRLAAIEALGVETTVVIPFDAAIAAVGHREFVDNFLIGELSVGSLHVSKGFSFGRDSAGSTAYLEERAGQLGFAVVRVPPRLLADMPVSSTRIRELVTLGNMADANDLLTRPFALAGTVIEGAGRGRLLDRPTANLAPENACRPATGVYAARAVHAGGCHRAVVNIGRRPTFGHDDQVVVEAHLLGFDDDLYGSRLELQLLQRLRDERRFGSGEDLAQQILIDIEQAHQVLDASPTRAEAIAPTASQRDSSS